MLIRGDVDPRSVAYTSTQPKCLESNERWVEGLGDVVSNSPDRDKRLHIEWDLGRSGSWLCFLCCQ